MTAVPKSKVSGTIVAVHPDNDSIVLRFEASLFGVDVLTGEFLPKDKAFLIDLDKLAELPEPGSFLP